MLFKICSSAVCALLVSVLSLQAIAEQAKIQESRQEQSIRADIETVPLTFSNNVSIEVEFANDQQSRALGLMYRRELCEDCGMLFKFDSVRIANIWMKNTYIPLDLAYINAFGKIIDIKQLEPHDLTSVASSMPVLYALEMNQGWFQKNGLSTGDTVTFPSYIK